MPKCCHLEELFKPISHTKACKFNSSLTAMATDHALSGYEDYGAGPGLGDVHIWVQKCHIWLNLVKMWDVKKVCFLNVPIVQSGLFSDTVEDRSSLR